MIRDINLDIDEVEAVLDNALEDQPENVDIVAIKKAIIETLKRVSKASNDRSKEDIFTELVFTLESLKRISLPGESNLSWAMRDIDPLGPDYISALENARENARNHELLGQALDTLDVLCDDAPDEVYKTVAKMFKKGA